MEHNYLINDKVLFNTQNNILIDKNNLSHRVTLNRPISRCLKLLIKNKGEITTQEEFFDVVWRSHGANITANTYYQNISILRRTLAQMGLGDEIIKTVSRKGLMLSQASRVVAITPEDRLTHDIENDSYHHAEQQELAKPQCTFKDHDLEACQPDVNTTSSGAVESDKMVNGNNEIRKDKDSLIVKIAILMTLILAMIAGIVEYVHHEKKQSDRFSDYTFIENIKECKVYSNHKFSRDETLLLNEKDFECSRKKRVFLTYFYFSPDIFMLSCNNAKGAKPFSSCISYYYVGGLDEV